MVEVWFRYLTTASLAPSSHRYHISPCIFLSLFPSHTHTHFLFCSHTHKHIVSHTHSFCLALALSYTHTDSVSLLFRQLRGSLPPRCKAELLAMAARVKRLSPSPLTWPRRGHPNGCHGHHPLSEQTKCTAEN